MWRLIVAQILRHRGRVAAMVASIVVTSVSFSLLTATVATSQVRVEGTVGKNFRNAYDILVRPPGSQSALEQSSNLVRQNYLSGIFGGITMKQYRQIKAMPGVEVAAPIAMVAYFTPIILANTPINDLVGEEQHQLFRISWSWSTDRGLTTVPDKEQYQFVNRQGSSRCPDVRKPTGMNAFDLPSQTGIWCNTAGRKSATSSEFFGDPYSFGGVYYYAFPMLLAAVDPVEEARLVGLDGAVVKGRYLRETDKPRVVRAAKTNANSLRYPRVPILMADQPLLDQTLNVNVERLNVSQQDLVGAGDEARLTWLQGLKGQTVQGTTVSMDEIYERVLKLYRKRINLGATNAWTAGQVDYGQDGGELRPQTTHNDRFVWRDARMGFLAPRLAVDKAFRKLEGYPASNLIHANVNYAPALRWVGLYDADKIRDYSDLSEVPLTTYHAPDARPADPETAQLLGGQSLLPNGNLAGYLQQPPTALTTLRGMKAFYDQRGFPGRDGSAPLSVIRIRVAGVTGPDAESRERVRVLAEQIIRETGLDVDVTIGSSPTEKTIVLPAGKYGRPELWLSEGWVHKGVAVVLLEAIDQKSLLVSLLVLGVCLLFLVNATLAAVQSRRRELGILSCLGWPRRKIFALLETELLVIGIGAGLLGTASAALLLGVTDLNLSWWQLVAITPLAALLAVLGGLVPVWRACATTPVEAIRPAGRAPRRASRVRSISGLAFAGLRRVPGRTLLGASCLFVGAAALTSLVAIQTAFHGEVVGTRLGDFVAVQVRGVDYLAAAITIALGAFAIADIAYLNIRERVDEVGVLQATGWSTRHLQRMFATEGITTAVIGSVTGVVAGLVLTNALLAIGWQSAATAGAIAAAISIAAAILALIAPLSRISNIQPAHALTYE